MTKNGGTVKYRIDRLEKSVEKIEHNIDEIMSNHLSHIKEEMAELKTTVRMTSIINAGAIILALLVSKLLL